MKKKVNLEELHSIYEQRFNTIKILEAIKNDEAYIMKVRNHDTEEGRKVAKNEDIHTFNETTKMLLIEAYERRIKLYDDEILKIIGEK